MAWGRIDDAFDDHPKVLALLEMEGAASAVGLWTLCFTWAHRNTRKKGKTPGLIPASLPRRFFGPEARSMAELLVKVGLWDVVDEGGWMIHDFGDYLPGREVSEARSAAGKRGAAKRWGSKEPPPDGNPVADAKQDDGKPMAPPSQDHSNLPSDDGSEPSADGKPMASDSSRAGARREWVAVGTTVLSPIPTPEPIPPSAGADAPRPPEDRPLNAGDVVAAYVGGAKAGDMPQPTDVLRGRMGKRAAALIKQGTAPQRLLTAAWNCGIAGWNDIDVQLQRDAAAEKVGPLRATGTDGRSTGHGDSGPFLTRQDYSKARI